MSLYKAWRIAICRVWCIPWQTHSNMLPLIAGVMDPEFWFAKRSINFLNMALNSSSENVKWISNIGTFQNIFNYGWKYKVINWKIWHECKKNVVKAWNERTSKNEELVRVSEHVKEVVGMRNRYIGSVISREWMWWYFNIFMYWVGVGSWNILFYILCMY